MDTFRVAELRGEPGTFHDCFGVRTRISYLPAMYERYSGAVAGFEDQQQLPMHDHVEMEGMLDAALAASNCFTVVELGAGWGPWVTMGAAMARKRGLRFRLIAVEGSLDHFEFMKTHFADNNIDPGEHRILHGVVSTKDGVAKFPKAPNPADDYGGFIGQGGDHEEVRAYSLASLLAGEPVVDIIHCDIQGHEVEVLAPAVAVLGRRVRRIVVGTHSKEIEERLRDIFSKEGWRPDGDLTCSFKEENGQSILVQDGAQLWVNPNVEAGQPLNLGRSWLRRVVQNWRSGH